MPKNKSVSRRNQIRRERRREKREFVKDPTNFSDSFESNWPANNGIENANRDTNRKKGPFRLKIEPKTETQGLLMSHLTTTDIIIVSGPAGTGKTAVSTLMASEMLYNGKFKHIVLSRPLVEIGKSMGALPGDKMEKFEPYLIPFIEHLEMAFGPNDVECKIKNKVIKPVPISFIQGHTWNDSIILIDEAQNLEENEMYILLTRLGNNSRIVIIGDVNQPANSKFKGTNGLKDLINKIKTKANNVTFEGNELVHIQFENKDSVRNKLTRKINSLYGNE